MRAGRPRSNRRPCSPMPQPVGAPKHRLLDAASPAWPASSPEVISTGTRRASLMDGWMNGWMDGWMDEWMNEWMEIHPCTISDHRPLLRRLLLRQARAVISMRPNVTVPAVLDSKDPARTKRKCRPRQPADLFRTSSSPDRRKSSPRSCLWEAADGSEPVPTSA